jgi:hypothetical protein
MADSAADRQTLEATLSQLKAEFQQLAKDAPDLRIRLLESTPGNIKATLTAVERAGDGTPDYDGTLEKFFRLAVRGGALLENFVGREVCPDNATRGEAILSADKPLARWAIFLLTRQKHRWQFDKAESDANQTTMYTDNASEVSEIAVEQLLAVCAERLKDQAYSEAKSPADWTKVIDLSWKTISRYIDQGKLRAIRISTRRIRLHKDDLAKLPHKQPRTK